MRVLFVFPDQSSTVTNYTGVMSQGIALLSALLRHDGHETQLLHLIQPADKEHFTARVGAAKPDLVAFSSNSHYARRLSHWTAWTREAVPSARLVVGGVHATVCPDSVEALPAVDFVCVGEGEVALPGLCRALAAGDDPSDLPGFHVRTDQGWRRNPPPPLVADLDSLPDPHYDLFDFPTLYNVRRGLFPFIMSRGCAFRCTYCCCRTLLDRAGRGLYWRFESPDHAARRLRRLIDRHAPDTDTVQFLDAILFPNRTWLRDFATAYVEHVDLPFNCNLRADLVDADVAAILAGMGCRVVRFGVESGDPWLTDAVLDRQLTVDDLREAFALLAGVGIERWSYNMVGLPHENLRRALATVRLNGEMAPDLAIPFIFYPYPGTKLHDVCADEGWLTGREFDHYFDGVSLCQPGFPEGDVLFLHRFFERLISLYGVGRAWSPARRRHWFAAIDAVLTSPLLPRTTLARTWIGYKSLRHRCGEFLVNRSPALYRTLGGTDPVAP